MANVGNSWLEYRSGPRDGRRADVYCTWASGWLAPANHQWSLVTVRCGSNTRRRRRRRRRTHSNPKDWPKAAAAAAGGTVQQIRTLSEDASRAGHLFSVAPSTPGWSAIRRVWCCGWHAFCGPINRCNGPTVTPSNNKLLTRVEKFYSRHICHKVHPKHFHAWIPRIAGPPTRRGPPSRHVSTFMRAMSVNDGSHRRTREHGYRLRASVAACNSDIVLQSCLLLVHLQRPVLSKSTQLNSAWLDYCWAESG